MQKLKNKINNSAYLKNILILTSGSVIAQAIAICASPIVTRLYTSAQLGAYTLALSIISMFGPVICGRYEMSIVTAEDDSEIYNLIGLSSIITVVFSIFVAIGYTIYINNNLEIMEQLGYSSYVIILILIITGLTNILTSYNNRNKQYSIISSVTVIRSVVQYVCQIVLGLIKASSANLVFSNLICSIFGIKRQGKYLWKNRVNINTIRFREMKNCFFKYKKQLLFGAPASFMNLASYSILNFFITGLFGLGTFGYYSLSFRMLNLPLSIIGMNVSKVFFQKSSEELQSEGNYIKSLKKFSAFLALISIIMVIFLMLTAPFLFEIFFGEGWNVAGRYVVILAPMYGIRLIVSSVSTSLIVSQKQDSELVMQILFVISGIITYFICKEFQLPIENFLILISIIYSLVYVIFYLYIYKLSKGDKNYD